MNPFGLRGVAAKLTRPATATRMGGIAGAGGVARGIKPSSAGGIGIGRPATLGGFAGLPGGTAMGGGKGPGWFGRPPAAAGAMEGPIQQLTSFLSRGTGAMHGPSFLWGAWGGLTMPFRSDLPGMLGRAAGGPGMSRQIGALAGAGVGVLGAARIGSAVLGMDVTDIGAFAGGHYLGARGWAGGRGFFGGKYTAGRGMFYGAVGVGVKNLLLGF